MIREAFVAPKGFDLISIDYSQIELRIMAHLSKDEGLITAFENGKTFTPPLLRKCLVQPMIKLGEVQSHKFWTHLWNVSIRARQGSGCDSPEAADYIASYFGKYPGVKIYMDEMKAKAKDQGYVETAFGRRLYLPGIHSGRTRMAAERAAINAPMQGLLQNYEISHDQHA